MPKKGKLNIEGIPNIEPLEDGTYRLVPMIAIPENQLWAWRSDVQSSIETSLQEYHEGKSVTLDSAKGTAFQRKLAGK